MSSNAIVPTDGAPSPSKQAKPAAEGESLYYTKLALRARTKIVSTIGPACCDPERLEALASAGVDVFRLNMAHAGPEAQQEHVDNLRAISNRIGFPIGILADLAGPKIRLGDVHEDRVFCETDQEFFFIEGDTPGGPDEFTCTYKPLVSELSVGDRVMLADGTVALIVEEKLEDRVRVRTVQRGVIRSRQGINLPGVNLSAPAISMTDHQHAEWCAKAGVDYVSLSFVRTPDEVRVLRDILRSNGSKAHVIAKIEKGEALVRLDEIVKNADGIMVARGDLGVEIDVAQMPIEQKRIIDACHRYQKPVIVATQMLDSMHDSLQPKRSEVTDVANAVLDGGDACMLSGETAIGKYPLETVEMMNRICRATESSDVHRIPKLRNIVESATISVVTSAVVKSAGSLARDLGAKLLVVASHSGRTALGLSQQRSSVPVIGVSSSEETLRRMCLYWGVTPLRGAPACDLQELIRYADRWSCRVGLCHKGDRIVIVGGSHLTDGSQANVAISGEHDIITVHEIEGLE
ncbi:Pyruvate kinase [Pseudobythopirellula maris]|uniref:Pyruvate kinase n=1 Tax=Pseudobythopirellula maris TaxID=2527991 RepID=A0A5C5ZGV2_9BACT|nr:pyruvate kinase [Pseudobythopirellula maris]TWT86554.1 Pyruvate kinase [Pseudobythopirellula maris]